MSIEIVQRDSRWQIFYGDVSLLFDTTSTEVKWPLVFSCVASALKLDLPNLTLIDSEGNEIVLTNALSNKEIDMVGDFREKMTTDIGLANQHNSLLFDSYEVMIKKWREIRHTENQSL